MSSALFWLEYLELNDSSLVVVTVAVIRCRENGNSLREVLILPMMHLKTLELNFVTTNQRKKLVSNQEVTEGLSAKHIGTTSLRV